MGLLGPSAVLREQPAVIAYESNSWGVDPIPFDQPVEPTVLPPDGSHSAAQRAVPRRSGPLQKGRRTSLTRSPYMRRRALVAPKLSEGKRTLIRD